MTTKGCEVLYVKCDKGKKTKSVFELKMGLIY